MAKITKITVGRLFNLGNYEHVRYDLTVEIAPGESAASAIHGVERIIAGMKPVRHVESEAALAHKAKEIETMRTMTDEQWRRSYGHCEGSREEVIRRYTESHEKYVAEREKALSTARRARELFDDLAGAEKWTDAKLEWDESDY